MDEKKIIKILQKTTSDNDHEALTAIRLANNILKNKNLHWNEFFSNVSSVDSNNFSVTSLKRINQLERQIVFYRNEEKKITRLEGKVVELENQLRYYKNKDKNNIKCPFLEDFSGYHEDIHSEVVSVKDKIDISMDAMPHNAFLHSLNDFWKNYGYLTPKQMGVLNDIYFNL